MFCLLRPVYLYSLSVRKFASARRVLDGRGLSALVLVTASILLSLLWGSVGADGNANPLYGSDIATRLFDDFEGTTRAETIASSAGFESGYIQGQALALKDTAAFARYSDSWWVQNADGFHESGTIEFYFRPETYIYSSTKTHGMLLTIGERPNPPAVTRLPQLSVTDEGYVNWALSRSSFGTTYFEAVTTDFLNRGQWYHIAATWGDGALKLYVNDTLAASVTADSFVEADTFLLGATGMVGSALGHAARGRIDRFRLSSRIRTAGEFPVALSVRIDSPSSALTVPKPVPVTYHAFATESRPRVVDLYADSDDIGFNGNLLARGLVESGTALVGGTLSDTDVFLYAVARAGDDSAYYYMPFSVTLVTSPLYSSVIDPVDSKITSVTPIGTAESFVAVMLNENVTTPAPLSAVADSTGTTADYTVTTRLSQAGDTAIIYIWTREPAGAILLGLRGDTTTMSGSLPRGIPNSEAGRTAFGATVISTEFLRSNGVMIGDTASTSSVGDSFAYTIEYQLSAATATRFFNLGFDIAAGSKMFAFFYADTYGSAWKEDSTVTVTVASGSGGGIKVIVAGITRDLPGGLGAASSSTATVSSTSGSACVLARHDFPGWLMTVLRWLRDVLLSCAAGRWVTDAYYLL